MGHTLMAQVHLHFESLELVREPSAGLGTHLFVGPLLEAVKFLVDVHICGSDSSERSGGARMFVGSGAIGKQGCRNDDGGPHIHTHTQMTDRQGRNEGMREPESKQE